ncbi:MAG: hypothetical protein AAGH15_20590, partial [Myxococcota bacterium]
PPPPLAPPLPEGFPAAAPGLAAGGRFACAHEADAPPLCWGSNRFRQLGEGASGYGAWRAEPAPVPGLGPVRRLALGGFHACALGLDARVRCWGHGGHGQLGPASTGEDQASPARVLEGASAVAAGGAFSCALVAGEALCWGANDRGQLGDGTPHARARPAPVQDARGAPLEGLVEIRLGRAHGCARNAPGAVWCWGEDVDGQVGGGGPDGARPRGSFRVARRAPLGHRPHARQVVPAGAGARARGAGASCPRHDAAWRGWGRNDARQLGVRAGGIWARPRDAEGLRDADEIGLGARHACVRFGGEIRCVGTSRDGALGLGDRRRSRELVPVPLEGPARALAVGIGFACAWLPAGPTCWGEGYGRAPVSVGTASDLASSVRSPGTP